MNPIIMHIQRLYGDNCRLCPPLEQAQYEAAGKMLPAPLFEMLKTSNGVEDLLTIPKTGETIAAGWILYPFEEICAETAAYAAIYGADGIVFAGDGAGGAFLLKPDGTVFYKDDYYEDAKLYAESLTVFFGKWKG